MKLPAAPVRPALERAAGRARDFIAAAKAPETIRAYRSDWRHFSAWCESAGVRAMPASPETVALYLADLAETHRPSTLARRLAAIAKAHGAAGYESPAKLGHPAVGETMHGIRRTKGTAPRVKTPLLTDDIRRMVSTLPATLTGVRDRAVLLLGFAGGFRRSELSALDAGDLTFTPEGLVVEIRFSKTDPLGLGRKVAIPAGGETCPVAAVRDWMGRAGIVTGPLFRGVDRHARVAAKRLHRDSIGVLVKRVAAAAGLDPRQYAGHSLRAGLATQAYLNGASELAIMRQTGHKSVAMVRRYIRDGSLFRDNPASKLGL